MSSKSISIADSMRGKEVEAALREAGARQVLSDSTMSLKDTLCMLVPLCIVTIVGPVMFMNSLLEVHHAFRVIVCGDTPELNSELK